MANDRDLEKVREALQVVLDQVDYTAGACELTTPVGAALPRVVIENARKALEETKGAKTDG